jgi:hypothetical protein
MRTIMWWSQFYMLYYVGFEVFTAVTMKNTFFWNVLPCRSCVNRRFEGTYRFHLHSRKISEWGTSSPIFLPWIWRQYIPPKLRFTQDLHSATSQKTAFFKCYIVDYHGGKPELWHSQLTTMFPLILVLPLKSLSYIHINQFISRHLLQHWH